MPSRPRHFSLVVLLALLIVSLPAALPAHAQTFTVTTTVDEDNGGATACSVNGCTLREAIRLANENAGPDTISFNIGGAAPFTISVSTSLPPLPPLSGGGTTINVTPAHSVVLSGVGRSSSFGLQITSANNTVRGLVVVGFPGSVASNGGSGISLSTAAATGNTIANNWLGINADGTSALGNAFYGLQIDESASNNLIGGSAAGEGNVIAGNLRANIAVDDSDSFTAAFITGNQIIGNFIGTNAAGTAAPTGLNDSSLEAGVFVGTYARSTLVKGNLIGGHIGPNLSIGGAAGVVVQSTETTAASTRHPQGTTIVGNDIGVTPAGVSLPNRIGIRLTGSAINTVIGDAADPVGGRNVIGNSTFDGIQLADNAVNISGTQIIGNYIGIARDGTTLAPIGTASATSGNTGIYLGTVTSGSPTTIGPANLIAAIRRFGIRVRSDGNTIKGNYIGTNPAGTTTSATSGTTAATIGFGTGGAGVWVENGTGNLIGGSGGGDRNVIAIGGSGGSVALASVALRPDVLAGSCTPACSVTSTTVQGNYLGVRATGDGALSSPISSSTEGLRISSTSGNTVRGNVISGAENGITLRNTANTNTIDANKIGTGASGSVASADAIGNTQNGIYIVQGTGNQITSNLLAFNGTGGSFFNDYHGINVASAAGGANNNNTISGNRLVSNGNQSVGNGSGIFIDGPTGILITQSTTSANKGDGIRFGAAGSNANLASPSLTSVTGSPPFLAGNAPGCSNGCTVEVFTSPTSDDKEGPVYLTTGTTTSGTFNINVAGCQRYLTATLRDAGNNTSPFSTQIDAFANAACVAPSFTLGAATPNSNLVVLGGSATYTHSITNNDGIARTFNVVIGSSRGWASGPSLVTVPANSSVPFNVLVSVPFSAQTSPTPDVDTTTVQAFVGTTGSAIQTDTTTAKLVTLNPAAPAVEPGKTKARPGTTISFTHSVTNTGDLLGTFSVVGPSGSGLPTFVGTPPAGWTIASVTPSGTFDLTGGGHTDIVIVVNTPAGAPAAPVQFSFIVKATNGAQTSPATVDTITVPVVRSFTFVATNPTGSPPTLSRPPGAAAPFVYTVTNTGNALDSFQVTPPANTSALSFSVSPSGSFNLAAGTSGTVTLTAQVAPGNTPIGNNDFSVSAQAVGGTGIPTAPAVAGRVTVIGGGSPQLVFGASTPSSLGAAGGTLDFVGTLTNTGNAAVPFIIGAPVVTGLPIGWSALTTGSNCPTTPSTLGIGLNCTFTLRVTVPAGADGGPQAVTISATADNGVVGASAEDVTISSTVTANVDIVRSVGLSVATPSGTQSGIPGTVLTFTHTLTNLGNAPDSFTISLAPTAPATATMAVLNPTSLVNVPRNVPAGNGTRTVTVVVTVPSGVAAGNLKFTVTASNAGTSASQDDIATIQAFDAAQLSPGTSKNGLPGTTVTFTHVLTNTGSTTLDFNVTATNSQAGFISPPISPILSVSPGVTRTVTIQVQLPLGAAGATSNTTTVQVTKVGSAAILASATDTSRVGNAFDVQITPDRTDVGYPSTTLVFTHTVTNIGINADTYTITATNSLSWPGGVSPDLFTLAPGASQVILVTIDVPNDNSTLAGTLNFGRVRVVSKTKPDVSHDEAVENIRVGQTAAVDFSADQARAVTPSSGTIRMSDLVLKNNGNNTDTFDITVLGADSGWAVTIIPSDALGPRETDYNVGVRVTVPSTVQPGPIKTITIQARSRFSSTVLGEVRLRFVYIAPAVVVERVIYSSYLPVVAR